MNLVTKFSSRDFIFKNFHLVQINFAEIYCETLKTFLLATKFIELNVVVINPYIKEMLPNFTINTLMVFSRLRNSMK